MRIQRTKWKNRPSAKRLLLEADALSAQANNLREKAWAQMRLARYRLESRLRQQIDEVQA